MIYKTLKETIDELDPSTGGTAKPIDQDRKWVGVGLDGTLSLSPPTEDYSKALLGPVPKMKERVIKWLNQGRRVKILTPRAADPEQVSAIDAWLNQHGFPALEITRTIDPDMIEYWDARVIQTVKNQGISIKEYIDHVK